MNRKYTFLFIFFLFSLITFSQNNKIYNPEDNSRQKIDSLIKIAQSENKFILLQVGGNWCIWCLRFNKLSQENPIIKETLNSNFLVYHLNYSKENKNENILTELEYPQRFGFPVFVILNDKGIRIHTQQSDYLENGSTGYDTEKVVKFLNQWSPKALNPINYK